MAGNTNRRPNPGYDADEYWRDHPELHNIPIYYASSLAKRCMSIYQTYVHMMNDRYYIYNMMNDMC